MYRAHSKDINRNKSFHPLTYGNLRRVELLKEGVEEKKQRAADRQKELQYDQEERRYDELVLANSADSHSGELARFRQTKNIFKAEYEAEFAKRQREMKEEEGANNNNSDVFSSSPSSKNAFLSKFKKECYTHGQFAKVDVKAESPEDSSSSNKTHGKRPREDEGEKEDNNKGVKSNGATTGFVTSAEAAQLRKELNLAQKQRHDPLMRVRQYQNSCVATAARQQQQQQQQGDSEVSSGHIRKQRNVTIAKDDKDALQGRIRELLALKKKN